MEGRREGGKRSGSVGSVGSGGARDQPPDALSSGPSGPPPSPPRPRSPDAEDRDLARRRERSRQRARSPSTLQSREQYAISRPPSRPGANSRAHTRQLAGEAARLCARRRCLLSSSMRARPALRHASEQYRTLELTAENPHPHCTQRRLAAPLAAAMALRRAALDARRLAAWAARLSGSARYLRMYSRLYARAASARHSSEQYTLSPAFLPLAANLREHTRHTSAAVPAPRFAFAFAFAFAFVFAPASGPAAPRASAPGSGSRVRRYWRPYPLFRHSSEQNRMERVGV